MPIKITLDRKHIDYCDELGRKRQESADRHNRRGGNGGEPCGDNALDMNVKGACGECAAYLRQMIENEAVNNLLANPVPVGNGAMALAGLKAALDGIGDQAAQSQLLRTIRNIEGAAQPK